MSAAYLYDYRAAKQKHGTVLAVLGGILHVSVNFAWFALTTISEGMLLGIGLAATARMLGVW